MTIKVSDLIEKNATAEEYQAGFDIADFLIGVSPDDNILQMLNTPAIPDTEPEQPVNGGSKQGSTVFVDVDGVLYIPTPPERKTYYTIYTSISAYNNRSEIPTMKKYQTIDTSCMIQKHIDMNTLTIAVWTS